MHWTQRLKQKNQQLEQENAQLQKELDSRVEGDLIEVDPFVDLKAAIAEDVKVVDAGMVGQAILEQVCIPYDCREEVFIMETGETQRAQPFRTTDAEYTIASKAMLIRILRETKVDAIPWQSEIYDCEKIARKFVTRCADLGINSVGRVISWSGEHAFCLAIVQKGDGVEAVFLEPQNDKIVTVLEGNYDLSNALIVIS